MRVLDPEPDRATLRKALRNLTERFPAFARARMVQEWAGLIDVTPDAVPVISKVDSVPGLVVATGFSGHGFGIGPAAGRLVADLVTGSTPIVDPTRFPLFALFATARTRGRWQGFGGGPRAAAGLDQKPRNMTSSNRE